MDDLLKPAPIQDLLKEAQEKLSEVKQQEVDVTQVVVTPAWQIVVDNLKLTSTPEAIIAELRPLLKDASVTNERLGELLRVAVSSSDKVQNVINQVIETVKAHEK